MSTSTLNRDVTVIVEGENLVDESVVEFDGMPLETTPLRETMLGETVFNPVYTQLEATVPGELLDRFGSYRVVVKNPRPQGGTSNALTFFAAP